MEAYEGLVVFFMVTVNVQVLFLIGMLDKFLLFFL